MTALKDDRTEKFGARVALNASEAGPRESILSRRGMDLAPCHGWWAPQAWGIYQLCFASCHLPSHVGYGLTAMASMCMLGEGHSRFSALSCTLVLQVGTESRASGCHHVWGRRRADANTTWKTAFDNGRRSPLVTGNAPVTDQVLQISQER
jgi:hypothetical protein